MKVLVGCARLFCVLTLSLLSLGVAKPTARKAPPSWFWGCWVVTKDLPTRGVSGLSQRQVDAIIGRRIVFRPTCARSGRIILRSPKYSVKVLSARDFFKLGYVPLSQIGIHEQHVTDVELDLPSNLSDLDFPGDSVFLRKTDIVIEVENEYLVAERAKPGDPACACGSPRAK